MTCSLAFLHDVCVSFLCKKHGTRVQSLTTFHSRKIKIQILIRKSAFAPNGNQPLLYGGNFAVFCQKSDASYSFSKAITPTPPHPGKQQSGSLPLTWSGKSITHARVLAGVGMSVPLCTRQGKWCLQMGHLQGPLLVGKQENPQTEKEKLMDLSGSHAPLSHPRIHALNLY